MQLQGAGKLTGAQNVSSTGCVHSLASSRLFLFDKRSHTKFLIDSGSDVSCIPVPNTATKLNPDSFELIAANNTKIYTYGSKMLDVNLGLRRSFKFKFLIASVPTPIIGADFLSHFGLIVDLKNRRLIDSVTNLSVSGITTSSFAPSLKLISGDSKYHKLLEQFPELTKISNKAIKVKHNTVHYIETTGPPIHSKPRRLNPKIYEEVKNEFQFMVDQGICRPSKSP